MEIDYLCPSCKSFINIGNKVVLSVRTKKEQKGLLLFEKLLGDYTVKKHDQIDYKNGDIVGFFCPICHNNLDSEIDANLAKVTILDDEKSEYDVLFSKIAGEKATFKINGGNIEAYGPDKDIYLEKIKKQIT